MVRAASSRADALVVAVFRPPLPSRLADVSAVGCVVVCLWILGGVWLLGRWMPPLARLRERWERLWLR